MITNESVMNVTGMTAVLSLLILNFLSLRDDLKSQADQIISFQSRLREIQSLLSENESQLLPLQYELNTVKREKELYENRNQFLESELEKKSTEFYQAKRDHLLALQDLELQLAQKNNECGEYQEKLKQFEVCLLQPPPSHSLSPLLP
jgi:chromosome segregation ATPase